MPVLVLNYLAFVHHESLECGNSGPQSWIVSQHILSDMEYLGRRCLPIFCFRKDQAWKDNQYKLSFARASVRTSGAVKYFIGHSGDSPSQHSLLT